MRTIVTRTARAVMLAAGLLGGCDARFANLCSAPECPYAGPGAGTSPDLSTAPADLAGADLAGTQPDLSTMTGERVFAAGMFMDRAGHLGSGDAQLYRRSDGQVEVRFGANFRCSGVPGPAVFLTSRTDMGAAINLQTDVNLGTLQSPMGAQSYLVPAGMDLGRRNIFVYCQPFRVEVAKAGLVDQ